MDCGENRLRPADSPSYLSETGNVGDSSSSSDSDLEARELRKRIADLERALALRDQVIATLGHELRNPLAPVTLQIAHLIETLEQSAPDRRWLLARLERLSGRFDAFVASLDRLLEASGPGGALSLDLERIDLAQVVREVCAGMESQLEAASSELVFEVSGPPVCGLWDRLRLQQITWNLLSNAVRYGAGSPIHVSVASAEDRASLVVRDHGVGISDEDQARIFEAYERGSNKAAGGFGLGLWIVRRLTTAMGGTIAVDSRPGEGSTFTVTLPAAGEAERE